MMALDETTTILNRGHYRVATNSVSPQVVGPALC